MIFGIGQQEPDGGDRFVYRASAEEIRYWARLVDAHQLDPDTTVFMVHSTTDQLVPLLSAGIKFPEIKQEYIDRQNAATEQRRAEMEANREPQPSPIQDIIDGIENGEELN